MAAKLLKRIKKKFSKIRGKNASYFIQENVIQGYGDLKAILNPLPKVKAINSNKLLSINEIPLNEIDVKLLKEKFGYPSIVLKNGHNIEKHKIYFYRDRIGFYKILIQFHFIGSEFFFVSTRLSVPKGLTIERKQKIVKQALIKYTGKAPKEVKSLDFKLVDESGNTLFVNDYVSFYLNYLVENDTKKQLYQELWEATDEQVEIEESNVEIERFI